MSSKNIHQEINIIFSTVFHDKKYLMDQ